MRKPKVSASDERLDSTKEEVRLQRIIRDSQYNEVKCLSTGLVDMDMIGAFFDPDEVRYDDLVSGLRVVKNGADVRDVDGTEPYSCYCCDDECLCEGGCILLRGCTKYDLMGIPESVRALLDIVRRRVTIIRGKVVEIFDLVLSFGFAKDIGLIESF